MEKRNKLIKLISGLLLILILAPAILFSIPKKVSADCLFANTPGTPCFTAPAPIAAPPASGWLQQVSNWLTTAATTSTGISGGALVADRVRVAAENVLKQAIIVIGHKLLDTITQSTVNWINSGFHGSPLFVQNPSSFFGNIAKTSVENIINQYGYNPTQYPFGQSFALNVINQYKSTLANDAAYSLSKVTNDPVLLNNYRTNFFAGGWNAFLINTQYPQNNYIGFNMMATNQLAQQLAGTSQNVAQTVRTTLQQGNGFLSPTMCPANINPNYNNGINEFNPPVFDDNTPYDPPACIHPGTSIQDISGIAGSDNANEDTSSQQSSYGTSYTASTCINQSDIDSYQAKYQATFNANKAAFNATSACIDPKTGKSALVATTPGAVAANHIMTALNLKTGVAGLDSALGNSMSAILNAFLNHFMSQGLSALGGAITGTPPADNWSYQGQTLTGTTNTAGTLSVPTNVTDTIGTPTSTTITSGTAPYSITSQPDNTIATAQISGSTLTVTGVANGQTSVTIQDSSTPAQTATIAINISNTGSLIIDFSNPTALQSISGNTTSATNITIQGGIAPFTIQTQPDSSIGLAIISQNTLTIVGVNPGITSITLQDSSTPAQTITLPLTIGTPSALSVTPATIAATSGGSTTTATLSGGTAPYTIVTQPDSSIASAILSGSTLNVVGVAPGSTSLVLQDSFSPANTITVPITVTAPATTTTTTSTNPQI